MKILFCHDGSSNTDTVLQKVISMFRSGKPEILLLTIVEESQDASSEHEEAFESEMEKRKKIMAVVAGKIVNEGLNAEVLIYSGGPKKTIQKVADMKKPDLVVVTRRKEGNILQKLYGSISEFLIRNSNYPVLVFRES